jgi:hypothetical protein
MVVPTGREIVTGGIRGRVPVMGLGSEPSVVKRTPVLVVVEEMVTVRGEG